MRYGSSSGKRMLNLLFLQKVLRVAAVSMPLLITPQVALARDGGFTLHGSIVNSSCTVIGLNGLAADAGFRVLEVAPGIAMQVSTEHNVCGNQAVPFATSYQQLPVTTRIDHEPNQASAALVTLSYQ
ncbi:Uncharacterized protein ALO83_03582 [Pseudomonas cannabina pv. alisalensis]|uniref:Fimbrial protein n=4 Tax=Pseudomonas TaxID=286 RepID=A0A3M3Q6F6_PSECA|nr:Uncharacterized protein ALO83_03582 [Pseudomonas cannabina pv. alisalensis]QHE96222.1 hypothetical protein PMA4326_006090 [Pseudomonas syringae pv. maculicola str. ES4326]RMN79748.1 hypothetical protein ALQ53_102658 [Pseudomonas cannabina]RMN80423.1 hypothetical protein ALQ52_103345 [Pseudomonas cannabina pv. alisalensis]RMN87215.1 hypothetical protein ALQ51_101559 [Pseudomonas cannabina]